MFDVAKSVENFFSEIVFQLDSEAKSVYANDIENQKNFFLSIINDLENGIKIGQKNKDGWVRYELVDNNYVFDSVKFITFLAGLKARKKVFAGKIFLEVKPFTPQKI